MGKGSAPRPFSVTNEEYANRWDAIFGRDVKDDTSEEHVGEEEEVRHDCPNCRSELDRKLLCIRSDYERDVVVRRYQWLCSECDYGGDVEEVVE